MIELAVVEVELGVAEVEFELAWEGFWLVDVCLYGFWFVFVRVEEGTTEGTESAEAGRRLFMGFEVSKEFDR